jgi:hypothetical protein
MLSIVRNRSYAPGSLLSLNDYRELEAHAKSSSVNNEGESGAEEAAGCGLRSQVFMQQQKNFSG